MKKASMPVLLLLLLVDKAHLRFLYQVVLADTVLSHCQEVSVVDMLQFQLSLLKAKRLGQVTDLLIHTEDQMRMQTNLSILTEEIVSQLYHP